MAEAAQPCRRCMVWELSKRRPKHKKRVVMQAIPRGRVVLSEHAHGQVEARRAARRVAGQV